MFESRRGYHHHLGVAQSGRVLPSEGRGREIEARHPDQHCGDQGGKSGSEPDDAGSSPSSAANMRCCQSGYVLACKAMLGAFDSPAHLHHASVAQWTERRSSTPGRRVFESSRKRHLDVAQLDRAAAS